jgi:cytidylate kinase
MSSPHRFVVTIDGAAGTGKTSVAQELANRLGTDCLDTGAMYRAIAVFAVDNDISPDDGVALATAVQEIGIGFDWNQNPPSILLGDEDVSKRIRDLDISGVVSIVAKQTEVREVLVEQQRRIGREHPLLVTEGRDQGSVVFPNATVRFFLQAKMDERTKRRVKQLRESGKVVDDAQVHQDISSRDKIDSTRSDGPLICPEGALVIDTSDKTMMEVVDLMEKSVRSVLPI